MMKKKIFWINSQPNNIYLNLYDSLGRYKNLDLHLVLAKPYENKNIGQRIFKTYYLEVSDILSKIYSLIGKNDYIPCIRSYKQFNKFLNKHKPDLIISNIFYRFYSIQCARYCKKHNIPLILQTEIQRFPKHFIDRILTKISLKILKYVLFRKTYKILPWTSDGVIFAHKNFGVKNKNHIQLLPAGIDTKLFHKVKEKKKKNGVLKILHIGRFVDYKRHIDALLAMKYLKEKTDLKFKLTIIKRPGPNGSKIERWIKKFKLSDCVELKDPVPYEKVKELYCSHDILILPSYNEAIGMVVPEAMACGVPTIISDTVGAKTYVENGKTGYLFKTFDYKDLAQKILLIKDKTKEFGKKAEKEIKAKYDLKVITQKLYNIIIGGLKWN